MYKELEIKFKDGTFNHYSPIDEMKMINEEDIVNITYYGTLSLFTDRLNLSDIEYMKITSCENMEVLDSEVIFSDDLCNIKAFDNLSDGTYGMLKNKKIFRLR